jgi:hypothetical protein
MTPADLTLLRASITPSLRSLGGGVNMGVPYILYLPADDLFCLHQGGSPQCKSADPALLGYMLRRERQEPGFIARALSPALDPETALLPAPALAARQSALDAQSASTARAREASEDAAWRKRRLQLLDPTAISLDDLD